MSSENPILLSFIVPVYNAQDTLAAALDSVLAAGRPDVEVLLVDDASTDGSAAACAALAARHPGVAFLPQAENRGPGVARNIGMDAARGEYLYFLDADDTIASEALPALLEALGHPEAELYFANYAMVDPASGHASVRNLFPRAQVYTREAFWQAHPEVQVMWSAAYSRGFLEEEGIRFPPHYYSEDTGFLLRALAASRHVAVLPQVLYRYNINPGASLMKNALDNAARIFEGTASTQAIIEELYRADGGAALRKALVGWWLPDMVYVLQLLPPGRLQARLAAGPPPVAPPAPDAGASEAGLEALAAAFLLEIKGRVGDRLAGRRLWIAPATRANMTLGEAFALAGLPVAGYADQKAESPSHPVLGQYRERGATLATGEELRPGRDGVLINHRKGMIVDEMARQYEERGFVRGENLFLLGDIAEAFFEKTQVSPNRSETQ